MAETDPTQMTVAEIRAAVREIDDADTLDTMREAEVADKDRVTAIDAIEERLDQLDDEQAEVADAVVDGQDGTTRIYVRNLDGKPKKAAGHWFDPGETKLVKKTASVEQALRRGQLQFVAD